MCTKCRPNWNLISYFNKSLHHNSYEKKPVCSRKSFMSWNTYAPSIAWNIWYYLFMQSHKQLLAETASNPILKVNIERAWVISEHLIARWPVYFVWLLHIEIRSVYWHLLSNYWWKWQIFMTFVTPIRSQTPADQTVEFSQSTLKLYALEIKLKIF